jgi:hypothetical protein
VIAMPPPPPRGQGPVESSRPPDTGPHFSLDLLTYVNPRIWPILVDFVHAEAPDPSVQICIKPLMSLQNLLFLYIQTTSTCMLLMCTYRHIAAHS